MRALLGFLIGCGAKVQVGDDGGDDTAVETGDADTAAVEVNPYVSSVDRLECVDEGANGETWYVDLTVGDPQGADTVVIGGFDVLDAAGNELAYYGLECWDGVCRSYFRAEYDNLPCAVGPTLTFVFTVQDEDGNGSEPVSVPGG